MDPRHGISSVLSSRAKTDSRLFSTFQHLFALYIRKAEQIDCKQKKICVLGIHKQCSGNRQFQTTVLNPAWNSFLSFQIKKRIKIGHGIIF
jgi:ribosome biogenesis protein Tsr3